MTWLFMNTTSNNKELTILVERLHSSYLNNFDSMLLMGIFIYFGLRFWLCTDLFVMEDTKAWL